ncbi:protein translocase subunit SecD [Stomatohabitans albus]|uniref:protein translocase subunit SecD n=1 Tax=Stomatohabitans albus TaxID=3110766 RepID=UPI00300D52D9
MGWKKLAALMIGPIVVVAILYGWILTNNLTPRLGLDLQGGLSANLVAKPNPGETITDEVLDQTVDIIRERVDSLGVAEPTIARQGETIQVQLPGLVDEGQARDVIGRTASMQFRSVKEILPAGDPQALKCDDPSLGPGDNDQEVKLCMRTQDPNTGEDLPRDQWQTVVANPTFLTGDQLDDAQAALEQNTNRWVTSMNFNAEGETAFGDETAKLACNQYPMNAIAIVLDGIIETVSPMSEQVQCGVGIRGGSAQIDTGERQASETLALVLRSGALPLQLEFGTFQQISPSLGADSLQAGLVAGLIGTLLVGVYLVILYRGIGFFGMFELAMFGLWIYALITLLGEYVGFTLTLAGIAGVIVSIGTAVDSSILYRERYRDELRTGRSIRSASDHAFLEAWRTNLTGSIVSILAAVVLYLLAIGEVRGFAFTLGLSVFVDLLMFGTFTQGMFGLLTRSPRIAQMKIMGLLGGLTDEQRAVIEQHRITAEQEAAKRRGVRRAAAAAAATESTAKEGDDA